MVMDSELQRRELVEAYRPGDLETLFRILKESDGLPIQVDGLVRLELKDARERKAWDKFDQIARAYVDASIDNYGGAINEFHTKFLIELAGDRVSVARYAIGKIERTVAAEAKKGLVVAKDIAEHYKFDDCVKRVSNKIGIIGEGDE